MMLFKVTINFESSSKWASVLSLSIPLKVFEYHCVAFYQSRTTLNNLQNGAYLHRRVNCILICLLSILQLDKPTYFDKDDIALLQSKS